MGLRQQMRDYVNNESPYYAKTLVFVQSSGIDKSRLADSFGRYESKTRAIAALPGSSSASLRVAC